MNIDYQKIADKFNRMLGLVDVEHLPKTGDYNEIRVHYKDVYKTVKHKQITLCDQTLVIHEIENRIITAYLKLVHPEAVA